MAEWLKIDKEMAAATYESSVKTFSEDLNLPDSGLRLLIDEAKRVAKTARSPLQKLQTCRFSEKRRKSLALLGDEPKA